MTAEYLGRIKGMKTLKQIIAEGIVTPASALEERKAQDEREKLEFASSVEDEERYRRVRPSMANPPLTIAGSSDQQYSRVPLDED